MKFYKQFFCQFILHIFSSDLLNCFFLCSRILSGCYDNTLHIWTAKGKHHLTITGHTQPIKAVAWISLNDEIGSFVRFVIDI